MPQPLKRPRRLKLYWVETLDHGEDWFILAYDRKQAARYHEAQEGYDRGDADAQWVATVPEELEAAPGWPHGDEVLRACGGIHKGKMKSSSPELAEQMGVVDDVWEFAGRTYVPGSIVDNIVAEHTERDAKH